MEAFYASWKETFVIILCSLQVFISKALLSFASKAMLLCRSSGHLNFIGISTPHEREESGIFSSRCFLFSHGVIFWLSKRWSMKDPPAAFSPQRHATVNNNSTYQSDWLPLSSPRYLYFIILQASFPLLLFMHDTNSLCICFSSHHSFSSKWRRLQSHVAD